MNRSSGDKWQAKCSDCGGCPLREKCIKGRGGKSPRTLYKIDRKGEEDYCREMRAKIDREEYRKLYGRRMQIIEPVFSDIGYCKGMHRFTLRTQRKVNTQWLLFCIVHNRGKCAAPMENKYAA